MLFAVTDRDVDRGAVSEGAFQLIDGVCDAAPEAGRRAANTRIVAGINREPAHDLDVGATTAVGQQPEGRAAVDLGRVEEAAVATAPGTHVPAIPGAQLDLAAVCQAYARQAARVPRH